MPTGPNGVFTLVPSYRATSGQTIRTEQHNPPLEDIAQGLTDRMMRNGTTPMTANLPMGGRKVTNMAPATAAGDAVTFGQLAGMIVMWSGSAASIPAGWSLCDGTNGTPDLRDRFIVGAGMSYAVGATGGAATVTLNVNQTPEHIHNLSGATSSVGDHSHLTDGTAAGSNGNSEVFAGRFGGGNSVSSGLYQRPTLPAGAHSHTFSGTTSSVGSNQAHENRPPYYALCFIRKN